MNSIREVKELNGCTIDQLKDLYENFRNRAKEDYYFELMPLEFEEFSEYVRAKIINGFMISEANVPVGFLIYLKGFNGAIDLNIIHFADDNNIDERKSELLSAFLSNIKLENDWSVISYPMLGVQKNFVRYISHQGFKLTGQAIVKFKINVAVSIALLSKCKVSDLPEGYSATSWKDEYLDQATDIIHETFKNASDADHDPRLTSLEGSSDAVNKVVKGLYGEFIPETTIALLYNGNLVGVCFVNFTCDNVANISLIGIKKPHNNKGFGIYILKKSIESILNLVAQDKSAACEINATVDTDNYPAFRMYRKVGFKEDCNYPHAYLKNPNCCN